MPGRSTGGCNTILAACTSACGACCRPQASATTICWQGFPNNRPQTRLDRGHQRLAQAQARMARLAQHEFAERRSRLLKFANAPAIRSTPARAWRFAGDTTAGIPQGDWKTHKGSASNDAAPACRPWARACTRSAPLATLSRGYAILLDEHSQSLVRSVQQAPAGTQLRAVLADGRLRLRVETGD
jgi:exodeoxyribonuclease VII large subunit